MPIIYYESVPIYSIPLYCFIFVECEHLCHAIVLIDEAAVSLHLAATMETEKKTGQDDINRAPSESGSTSDMAKNIFTTDEYQLAKLGYKQEFLRSLGFFESWAATFSSMNYASGIPVLFGFAMYTGGPTAAFANWTMVGGMKPFADRS